MPFQKLIHIKTFVYEIIHKYVLIVTSRFQMHLYSVDIDTSVFENYKS